MTAEQFLKGIFQDVKKQMSDTYAEYFEGMDGTDKVEIEVEKDGSRWVNYRIEGQEDWITIDSMEG